jgi:hypothetical protein
MMTSRGKPRKSEKHLPQCHLVHHESLIISQGLNPRPCNDKPGLYVSRRFRETVAVYGEKLAKYINAQLRQDTGSLMLKQLYGGWIPQWSPVISGGMTTNFFINIS